MAKARQRVAQRRVGELGVRGERPARGHQAAVEQVDHDRPPEPAAGEAHLGYVGDPLLVRPRRRELVAPLAQQQVGGRGRRDLAGVGAPAPAPARVARDQALAAHAAPHRPLGQAGRRRHPAVAVGAAGGLEGRPDQGVRLTVPPRGLPLGEPLPAAVVRAPRDTEESQYKTQGPPSLPTQSLA